MAKFKVSFDSETCVNAMACVGIAPDIWTEKDGKTSLKGATYNEATKKWELELDEKDFDRQKSAEQACPVGAISITKMEE